MSDNLFEKLCYLNLILALLNGFLFNSSVLTGVILTISCMLLAVFIVENI